MQRKLTAILSADVVGYSGMMEADEAGTLEKLKRNRVEIFDPAVAANGGRTFKLMGDGALVEFGSVMAAVNCAMAVQTATEKADRYGKHRIRYRIGINLGEVIVEGDDIYGEGVNVAARLQTLAPEGGVAISRLVRDQIDGKSPYAFEDAGEHNVKNIERPVHVFRVHALQEAAEPKKMSQSGKFSICVLPFANMSGDVEQEYFSDGISEDIITDLSKVSALSVVARNTAFTYKGKSVKIPQVARELGVSHVLEGSVRKAGGRVRITAQLIDGAAGDHIWAERYDRDLNDIFAMQDEISEAIVKALKLKLVPEEKKAIEQRGTTNAEAYNLYLMARQNYVIGNEGDARRAAAIVRLSGRAAQIDPNYARAWALKALGESILCFTFGQKNDGGLAAVEKALALDPDLAEAYATKTIILCDVGSLDKASAIIERALKLDPDSYEVHRAAARLRFRQNKLDDAIRHYEKATELMETDVTSPAMLVTCYSALERQQDAMTAAQTVLARATKALAMDQNNGVILAYGAIALLTLGQLDRAREWTDRAMLIEPDNMNMRYNFACGFARILGDADSALEMLGPVFEGGDVGFVKHAKADPDLDTLRDDPRFVAMVSAAEARLA
jgi:adenylate cyclase